MKPLVVVTRPTERAHDFINQCQKLNWQTLHLPLLDIIAKPDELNSLPEKINKADAIFFVSPTAVSKVANAIDFSKFSGRLIAVGKATCLAIQQYCGKDVVYPTDGNDSEAVLRLPIWNDCGRLLIIRGENGRDFLRDKLIKQGWQVDYADVYKRVARNPTSKQLSEIVNHNGKVAVVLTSSEIAQIWCESLTSENAQIVKRLLYLTIHQRIGDFLRKNGIHDVIDCVSETEIVNTLKHRWEFV
ncbi:MAG: uroporphyrinogen-III synthase [Neisseriaceae bacterium]|nr:uroporphyrinogen-III synthase [Neisseriaceae bacterium]